MRMQIVHIHRLFLFDSATVISANK